MSDLIDRQAAIEALGEEPEVWNDDETEIAERNQWRMDIDAIKAVPSAEPERAKYVPDTKAIPSSRDCVDLSERVTTTFYDDEHEEWSQKTVTIRDVLDSVCDEYTVLPSAEPERKTGRWIRHAIGHENTPWGFDCSVCNKWFVIGEDTANQYNYCPNCGCKMGVTGD